MVHHVLRAARTQARSISLSLFTPSLIKRGLSTPSPSSSSIFVSTSTSPYFNLSAEDWLFHKAPSENPLLFIYQNAPCVVIGRNQNPWKEINFSALHAHAVPFIRRRSGGGTVYHDLGNTNFSIHLPRTSFNRLRTAQLVRRALAALGIDALVNERNDICVGSFKVSGSAYKIAHARAYHHGTMLISTNLSSLGNILRNTKEGMVTKGVTSIRSPVHNLQNFRPGLTHAAFVDAMIAEFAREYHTNSHVQVLSEHDGSCNVDHIRDGIIALQTWEWKYGQTPEFTHRLSRVFDWGEITAEVSSKHGVIRSCNLVSSNVGEGGWCESLASSLEGVKYATLEGLPFEKFDARQQAVIDWLKVDM